AAIDQFAPQHIVIVSGNDSEGAVGLQKALNDVSAPGALQQLVADTTHVPQASPLSGKSAVDGKAAAYVCSGPQCSLAVTTPADLRQLIEENRKRTARS
ncbi:MAG: thioredoxin domain-containing protein, partial [Hyphomicrobiaceae bacterium]